MLWFHLVHALDAGLHRAYTLDAAMLHPEYTFDTSAHAAYALCATLHPALFDVNIEYLV